MRGETELQDVRHQWRRENQDQHKAHETRHLTSECARSLLVTSCCVCVVILTHCTPRRVAQVVRVFALISSMHEVSVTLRLWALHSIQLPTLLILLQSPAAPATSTRIRSNTVYSANKEMVSTDESCFRTGYEHKAYYLMETDVESLTESLTQPQFSEQRFLEDVDYDDAALEEMLHNAHRVHVYHSQQEGLCVGQSSSVSERTRRPVVERTGRFVVERGQELNAEHAQVRLFWTDRKSKSSPNVRRRLRNTNSRQINYDRRSMQKLSEIIKSQQEELHRAHAKELQRRDQQLLHAQVITAKFGITWSSK